MMMPAVTLSSSGYGMGPLQGVVRGESEAPAELARRSLRRSLNWLGRSLALPIGLALAAAANAEDAKPAPAVPRVTTIHEEQVAATPVSIVDGKLVLKAEPARASERRFWQHTDSRGAMAGTR
jgi:hypothetical protein